MSLLVARADVRALPLAAASVDAIVCDPPYEFGFMGKRWDASGVAFQCGTWAEVLRVLKPGGHLVAFGGSRTWHRLACAIEDAGFEIRDCLMWLYGSGFPKSLDVSKAIDRHNGDVRPVTGEWHQPGRGQRAESQAYGLTNDRGVYTSAASAASAAWDGWGTALKPSFEPVMWATKPGDGATIDASLSRLEADLWSMLSASGVALPSASSPSVSDEGLFDGARWSADGSPSTPDASPDLMATSPSVWAMTTSWNTVRSWRRILGAASALLSTSTIATASSLTTDLKTLSSSVASLTATNMHQNVMTARGSTPPVSDVVASFAGVARKLSAIRTLSAPATATAAERTSPPVGIERAPLSPAFEPIVLARKPLTGTVAQNVLAHGTGALNIDGTRIEGEPWIAHRATGLGSVKFFTEGDTPEIDKVPHAGGRWPANVLLDEDSAALLDQMTGELPITGYRTSASRDRWGAESPIVGQGGTNAKGVEYPGESGGASRFFYTAKASRGEREAGLEAFAPVRRSDGREQDIENPRLRTNERRNHHPTVKPVDLMRWLVRLVTPPNGIVLDPFLGSGSTGMAALDEGMRFIGFDLDPEYVALARQRIAHRHVLEGRLLAAGEGTEQLVLL